MVVAAKALASFARRHVEWLVVPVAYVVLVFSFYAAIGRGRAGLGWDLIESYWPDLAFLARSFAEGDFPLWNPFERGGYPAHADPQPGYFYPGHWLFAAAAMGHVSWWAIQAKELLHYALLASLMYLFLRRRRLPWPAAFVGGAASFLTGTWVGDQSNNFLIAMAWVPLVWTATDALCEQPDWRRGALLAAALYLPASVGSPPGYFYTLLLALAYGGFRVSGLVLSTLRQPRDLGRCMASLARALGVSVAVTAALQLLLLYPAIELTARSERATRSMSYAIDGYMGLPASLIGVVAPGGGTSHVYCGLLTVLLATVAATLVGRRDRGAPLFFVLAGLFFLVLSFGSQTPVLAWLVTNLPGFGLFRACSRYKISFGLCWAAASGYGVAALLELAQTRRRPRWLWLFAILAAFAVAVAYVVHRYPPTGLNADFYPAARVSFYFLAGAVLLAVVMALAPRRFAFGVPVLAVAFVFADAKTFLHHHPHGKGLQSRPDDLEDLAKIEGLSLAGYRIYDEFLLEQRAGSRLGLRELRGYTSFDPLASMEYRDLIVASNEHAQLLPEFNVKYVFHGPHTTKGWRPVSVQKAPDVTAPAHFRRVAPAIYEARFPAPQLAWYGGMQIAPHAQVLRTLLGARDANGVRRFAVVAEGELERTGLTAPAAPLIEAAASGRAPAGVAGKITRFRNDIVEAEIDAPAGGVVVLNEAHYPGWHVTVDGQSQTPFTVDHFLRGVLVPAGHHVLRWEYTPPRWGLLLMLWAVAMLVVLAALASSISPSFVRGRVNDVFTRLRNLARGSRA
jgi:hypothetical protein